MMVLAIIFLASILLSGCGARIYSGDQVAAQKQILADLLVVNDPTVKASPATREANAALAKELRRAMSLDISDLPTARVSLVEFQQNADDAAHKLKVVSDEAPVPQTFTAMVGSGITVATMLLLGVGAKLAKGTTLGAPLELIQTFLTTLDPKDTHLSDALVSSIEDYKDADPKWEENPLMIKLGKNLPTTLKDHIKHKIAKL